ncbi:peroxiredoxin [Galbitalea sp. SE-J8]|uniref:peroxiredoxin n=1 Tax=Galbitalea sp. SE-J8 TaxID=3054952 RepID=UPI00259C95FC|nr:peroxiredoxin [Galbitalea sp. SE-J8]MDM4762092.1 peroxiredoxin [Galbitalea sp. SE-J8]
MTAPDVGDLAPDFTLTAHDGSRWSLSAQTGPVIVYFYPAAFTPGCTTEACEFRDSFGPLRAAGWTVVGVSPDAPERNAEFVADQHLDFALLSDEDHAVHEAYATWGERVRNGETTVGPIRSTFAIDADGRIVLAWRAVDPVGQVARLVEALAA